VTPFFSVVIPTYNRKDALARCLEALARQTLEPSQFEVLVVDDGSTDGTAESLQGRRFPFALKTLRRPNGGASKARNAGVAAAAGEFVAFTEDDVVPDADWLARARERILREGVDVVDGRTVDLATRRDIRRCDSGGVPSFLPCNLFVRRAALEKAGGYDEGFYDADRHLYFREDVELGFRLLDAGCRVAAAPDAVVGHPEQFASLADCLRHGRRYVFDPLLFKKHPARYRAMIEAKRVFGVPVRRPQYLLSVVYATLLVAGAAAAAKDLKTAAWLWAAAFACSWLYRFKYQGARALRLYRLDETLGFLWAPLVYLGSLLRGCVRFGGWGALRPW
jgi:glycosyltransferase involved in cell wall biosynthesis